MEVARLNKNGQVSIPAEIRKKLNLKVGDDIGFELSPDGKVILQPVAIVAREQNYFYSSELQEKIRQAEAELESGQGAVFDEIDKALQWLKS